MDALTLWSLIGFLLAAYAVIANDSVQTLGTWIASNNERFNWKDYVGSCFSCITLYTMVWLLHVWWIFSYGRLNKIPFARSAVVSCCSTSYPSCYLTRWVYL